MPYNQLVDERLALLALDQRTAWSVRSQQVGDEEFHLMAVRLWELETEGYIEIIDARKESYSGYRRWSLVVFRRLR